VLQGCLPSYLVVESDLPVNCICMEHSCLLTYMLDCSGLIIAMSFRHLQKTHLRTIVSVRSCTCFNLKIYLFYFILSLFLLVLVRTLVTVGGIRTIFIVNSRVKIMNL
jgi:hypothetical protein